MFEARSADVRRFFDLLGSIFCGLIIGFVLSDEATRVYKTPRVLLFALFFIAGATVYLSFYKLVWRFVNTKFLYGYANFLMISVLSVSVAVVIVTANKVLLSGDDLSNSLRQLEMLISRMLPTKILLFYWVTSLPMAAFWLIGILTAWKFSKSKSLP